MKVSEITTQLVAEYVKADLANMSAEELIVLDAQLSAAKFYVRSQTGHVDEIVTGETLTESAEDTTVFTTEFSPIASGTLKVYINGVQVTTGFKAKLSTGTITFYEAPVATPTADYIAGIDAFEDFPIAVYVLCQDMHDNRSMYVDNANVNSVVENILSMHSINLL